MLITRFCAALAIMAIAAGPAMAVPYASKIRAAETTIAAGEGTSIEYRLNEESDSVTIAIVDGSENEVASFAGTTASGVNTVVWNGTVDNASGAEVAPGVYSIVITAVKNNTAWADITSHQSTGQYGPATVHADVFDGFSPVEMIPQLDTSSDYFGELYFLNSFAGGSRPAIAAIVFESDLTVRGGGDGYDTRILREPTMDGSGGANTTYWGGSIDPVDSNIVYIGGQSEPTFWVGDLNNPDQVVNADPSDYLGSNLPRTALVVQEGTDKYVYFTIGNGIYKAPLSGTQLSGPPVLVADLGRYALDLELDNEGNLYLASRHDGGGSANGALLRWDREVTLGPSPSLTTANAAWVINAGSGMLNLHGPAISPVDGNVYVLFATGNTVNTNNGVYLVGNTATATINRTLTTADRVVDFNTINGSSVWGINIVNGQVKTDAAGNIIVMDRTNEQVRMWTPGGTSNVSIPAPASQALTVTPRASVQDWAIY